MGRARVYFCLRKHTEGKNKYLDDIQLNRVMEIPGVVIDEVRMVEFARLYDPLPVHMDAAYAQGTRFGRMIAPGVMSFMAVWAEFIKMGLFGDELIAGKSTKIEWFKPVFAGDVLRGRAYVREIVRRNAYNGIAVVVVDVYNQHGEKVLADVTESVVKYRTQGRA